MKTMALLLLVSASGWAWAQSMPDQSNDSRPAEGEVVMELAPRGEPIKGWPGAWEVKDYGNSFWVISYPKITAPLYAVTGEICYRDVPSGSWEMTTNLVEVPPNNAPIYFRARKKSFITRTNLAQGPQAELKGTSDWRPFWLPFDLSQTKDHLDSIVINFGVTRNSTYAGPPAVFVRNVKLVQFPSGHFPASWAPDGKIPPPELYGSPSASTPLSKDQSVTTEIAKFYSDPVPKEQPTSPKASNGLDRKSFCLGVLATCLVLLGKAACAVVFRRFRQRYHERELRRIAAQDT